MDMKRVWLTLVTAMVLTLTAITPGCDSSMEGYKKVTVSKSIASCSFEYPVSYEDPFGSLLEGDPENSVLLLRPYADKWYADIALSVIVENNGSLFTNAKDALDNLLYNYEHPYYDNKFILLERSSVEVSGVTGEIVIFSITMAPDYYLGPHSAVGRDVFFDHNGMIWNIHLYSHETIAEQAEADFEHILESFQILD